jgi:hypothetical protein
MLKRLSEYWSAGGNTCPTVGKGAVKPKNADCEGGVKDVSYISVLYIIDLPKTQ